MKLIRTANAGVLLELDGKKILIDGVCREVKPYPATPEHIKAKLLEELPDAVAFTHSHKDHYDPVFAVEYLQKGGVILGPADCHGIMEPAVVGNVRITPIPSRHMGPAGKTAQHVGFWIEGSQRILFSGDSAPGQWQRLDLPTPDVMIVPYIYANTSYAWDATRKFGAKKIVLLHLPARQEDTLDLWHAVDATVGECDELLIPEIGENITVL